MPQAIVKLAALVILVFVGACGLVGPEACTDDLRWTVTPTEADLAVGESVTVRAEAFGCGGEEPLQEEMRWSSADPAVASVDEVTGQVTANAPGSTRILGEDVGPYRIGPVEIQVTVGVEQQ